MTFFVPSIVTCVSFLERELLRAQGNVRIVACLRQWPAAQQVENRTFREIMMHIYRGMSSSSVELPLSSLERGSVRCIAAGLGTLLLSFTAGAAETTEPTPSSELAEIVVTGSSIAQKLDSSSLPVTILSADEIAKTGFTSATDLLQNLPGMQGFVPASSSVNGGAGGVTTAAVHSLPSKYTLVLVDGQRVAGFTLGSVQGEGFGVNLSSIPLDAVERVEVLTDGASALYGADAIAGVVNFVLKKDQTEGSAYYNASIPEQSGGGGWNAGVSKGFGDLTNDGWNILSIFSKRDELSFQQSYLQHRACEHHHWPAGSIVQPLLSSEWQLRPRRAGGTAHGGGEHYLSLQLRGDG